MNCVIEAWNRYEGELRRFLTGQVQDRQVAEDLLQDTFLKALSEGSRFCQLQNPRAWLYRVTRNRLTDYHRTHRIHLELPDELPLAHETTDAVVSLAQCLPGALEALAPEQRDAIERCDLEGMTQAEYAKQVGISVAGAKSRVQRARKRLKAQLSKACQVRFDETGKVCCFVPRNSHRRRDVE